jgi:sugar phosphate isomerase/epimerase
MASSILLSTSIVALPVSARGLLESWRSLAAGLGGVALDPRLPPELCAELLPALRRAGLRCPELGHAWPAAGPSPVSADRSERRAAREQLEETLSAAERGAVRRVLLAPCSLPLEPARVQLARSFGRGEPLALDALSPARAALAAVALDGLASVLEPCLRRAEAQDQRLVLPWPAPWPHAFPNAAEVDALGAILAGSPLAACRALDWVDVARALDPEREAERCSTALACVRVADSCGLSQRLPLGGGEGSWREQLRELGDEEAERVLTFAPATCAAEVARSLELLEAST